VIAGDAEARRDHLLLDAHRPRGTAQDLRERRRLRKRHLRAEYEELFAAPAQERIPRREIRPHGLREPDEHRVTCLVPIRIIDLLEMIDIEHDEGERLLLLLGAYEIALEQRPEGRAAQGVCERVMRLAVTRCHDGGAQPRCPLAERLLPVRHPLQDGEQEHCDAVDAEWAEKHIPRQEMQICIDTVEDAEQREQYDGHEQGTAVIIPPPRSPRAPPENEWPEKRHEDKLKQEESLEPVHAEKLQQQRSREQEEEGTDEPADHTPFPAFQDLIDDGIRRDRQEIRRDRQHIPPEQDGIGEEILRIERRNAPEDEIPKEREQAPVPMLPPIEQSRDTQHADCHGQRENQRHVGEEDPLRLPLFRPQRKRPIDTECMRIPARECQRKRIGMRNLRQMHEMPHSPAAGRGQRCLIVCIDELLIEEDAHLLTRCEKEQRVLIAARQNLRRFVELPRPLRERRRRRKRKGLPITRALRRRLHHLQL